MRISLVGFVMGALVLLLLVLDTMLEWGWSNTGNWGYFLIAAFVAIGLMLFSLLLIVVSGIVVLVLRSRAKA